MCLVGQVDERLFRSTEFSPSLVLRDLLPSKAKQPYKRRPTAHHYVLPPYKNVRNCIYALFTHDVYQLSMNVNISDSVVKINILSLLISLLIHLLTLYVSLLSAM